jgi:hypothetical protein
MANGNDITEKARRCHIGHFDKMEIMDVYVQFVISWITILFSNGAKCEIDTRTFIVNLIFI